MSRLFPYAVLAAACVLTGCDLFSNPNEPSVPDTIVNYNAIGASDAIGYGGSSPCLPLVDCTTGTGYVQQVTQRLTAAGRTVTLYNLGIPGAVLSPETEAIGDGLGFDIFDDFLEREMPFVKKDATLVTIFAGGNDANTIGSATRANHASDADAFIAAQIDKFGRDMRTLVNGVRSRATEARLIVLNLPNMAAIPFANGRSAEEKRRLQQISVGFSAGINQVNGPGVQVLDLMCDPRFYDPSIFSADGFHPNDTGYTYLADLVYQAFTSGSSSAPRADCPQMHVF